MIFGNFFFSHKIYNNEYSKKTFDHLFTIKPNIEKILEKAFQENLTHHEADFLIGLHYRHGDVATVQETSWIYYHYLIPLLWYEKQIDILKEQYPNKKFLLYLASDSLEIAISELQKCYHDDVQIEIISRHDYSQNIQSQLLEEKLEDIDLFLDFYTLTQANFLLTSVSTFSFSAAMLNQRLHPNKPTTCFFRADPNTEKFEFFDPWNDEPRLLNKRGKIFTRSIQNENFQTE
jgi:hypothetical protein